MGDDERDDVRVWLVERTFTDKGLVTMTYATSDGERVLVEQRSGTALGDVTAAQDVAPHRLSPTDTSDRERYAAEAERMAERRDPDDVV